MPTVRASRLERRLHRSARSARVTMPAGEVEMNESRRFRIVSAGLLCSVLLVASPASADDPPKVPPPGGEVLEMNKHMTGSVGETGQFPGKLVCLRSKESFAPLSASECAAGERLYALEMKEGNAMRPIQAGAPGVESQLAGLLGKEVLVQGRFHNSTGMLIAASIEEKQPS
jgi:hypothetical protein